MRVIAVALVLAGCAAETTAVTHDDAKNEPASDAPSTFESCMAACQNTSFSCNVGGVSSVDAYLAVETLGCRGELGTRTLVVDCHERRVCIDDECKDATFNAMTVAWEKTLCTRN